MLCLVEGNECLVAEVVLEGHSFDVFLDAGGDLSLVAPGIYALEV